MQVVKRYSPIVLLSIPLLILGYFTERTNFTQLISLVGLIGIGYFVLLKYFKYSWREILIGGMLLRASLLFFTPNLSDDYYRFVWDGQVTVDGYNPYLVFPSRFIEKDSIKNDAYYQELFKKMNSQKYFTVYPPFNQFLFTTATFVSGKNLWLCSLILKLIILLFEIGTFYILFLILRKLKLAEHLASIYVFNPLVIVELVGNIHFEGVMLFFLLLGIYLLMNNRILLAGLAFAFAVNTKLIPLMLLPLFIGYLGWGRSIKFYLIGGVAVLLMFVPYYNFEIIENFKSSLNLYFDKFEFNASIYYVIRWFGLQITGHNIIQSVGYILPFVAIGTIAWKSIVIKRNDTLGLFRSMLFILTVYYLVASIIHPWYVINLVILSVFIKDKAILVWSVVIYLSYFAYSQYVIDTYNWDKHQSAMYFGLIALEYGIVFSVWLFSLRSKRLLSQQ